MDVDTAIEWGERLAEGPLRNVLLRHELASAAGEDLDQAEFRAGQFQAFAAPFGDPAARMNHEFSRPYRVGRSTGRRLSCPAEDSAQSRRKFARRAWLRHIVVGAQIETRYPVDVIAPCGQHQDRDLAELPDPLQNLDPVHPRHHDVEHDNIDRIAGRRRNGGAPVRIRDDVISFFDQIFLQKRRQLGIVVDEENLVHSLRPSLIRVSHTAQTQPRDRVLPNLTLT